ncbi:hypothetical protein GGD56_006746 [Rhizobium mongolense]|uniref:Uncharacterized protein n=2 Tax=Rhizobium mongolense TaxID=57676 RepID=A0ABR6IY72_9HYPH|nr:hypothetical protein [Rhizobium mongolense]TVZ75121.1 hypothetical protein BCL32_0537 [Rhizobium mongolense USDA 1844]
MLTWWTALVSIGSFSRGNFFEGGNSDHGMAPPKWVTRLGIAMHEPCQGDNLVKTIS